MLQAARELFADTGANPTMEHVARRAGVGIGTLYRSFPSRRELVESVFAAEVEALRKAASDLADQEPWLALTSWLGLLAEHALSREALRENREAGDSELLAAANELLAQAVSPLFARAQNSGFVRADIGVDDLLRMVSGLSSSTFLDDAQRERVLAVALDGVRGTRA